MKTKFLLMITLATITMSCKKTEGNNAENQNAVTETTDTQTPKCSDKVVKEALMSSIKQGLFDGLAIIDTSAVPLTIKKDEIKNILTRSKNNDLQKCECETDYIREFTNGEQRIDHIYYFAQKDSEGNVIVKQQEEPEDK
jgi:hypothetical protein|nr:hypothetical protein [uncultured Flavobacterium sp.]